MDRRGGQVGDDAETDARTLPVGLGRVGMVGLAADVERVREPARIGEYGVLGTPALVVGGKVVSTGKVLSTREVEGLLGKGVCDG